MPLTTGAILKTAREQLGLSQKEVAQRAFGDNESQSMVSRYEAELMEPSLQNLRKLAVALGLSLGDFDPPSVETTSLMSDSDGL